MKKLLAILLIIIATNVYSQENCQKKNSTTICKDQIQNYPEKVYSYYPDHLDLNLPTDIILFFHGFIYAENNDYEKDVIERFKFENELAKTKKNIVLIMPMSKGRAIDYKSFFSKQENYQLFMNDVIGLAKKFGVQKFGSLYLASHSGGYTPLINILNYNCEGFCHPNNIMGVYLFDSNYSLDSIKIIGQKMNEFRKNEKVFYSVYLKNGSTHQNNFESWKLSSTNPIKNLKNFDLESMFPSMITSKVGFIKTDKNHYDLVNENFISLLEQ